MKNEKLTRNYLFANHVFKISTIYNFFHVFAKDYQCDKLEEIVIEINHESIESWYIDHHLDKETYLEEYIETLVILSMLGEHLSKFDTYIFHGSSIYVDLLDNSYIFTAKSGVGKSTHVRLLKEMFPNRVFYINDDKPFLSKVKEDYIIYSSPYDGKERLSNNVNGVLKGIFVINRSPANEVKKLNPSDAPKFILEQINYPINIEGKKRAIEFAFLLIKDIPIYSLNVNMENDAPKVSMKIMERKQ